MPIAVVGRTVAALAEALRVIADDLVGREEIIGLISLTGIITAAHDGDTPDVWWPTALAARIVAALQRAATITDNAEIADTLVRDADTLNSLSEHIERPPLRSV